MKGYASRHSDMGEFKLNVYARVEYVNIISIFFHYTVRLNVTECVTDEVSAF